MSEKDTALSLLAGGSVVIMLYFIFLSGGASVGNPLASSATYKSYSDMETTFFIQNLASCTEYPENRVCTIIFGSNTTNEKFLKRNWKVKEVSFTASDNMRISARKYFMAENFNIVNVSGISCEEISDESGECTREKQVSHQEVRMNFSEIKLENFSGNEVYMLEFETGKWSMGKFNMTIVLYDEDTGEEFKINYDPDVTTCSVLSGPAFTVHTMTTDVQAFATCFDIKNHSLTLDCAGHSINYSQISAGSGVFVAGMLNITIKNCRIYMWNATAAGTTVGVNGTTFIRTNYSSLINITYVTIGNWSWGIGAHTSTNITIHNVSIKTNGTNRAYAISFVTCSNITANNIDIFTSGAVATGLRFGVNTQNGIFSNMNITTKGATSCAFQIDSCSFNTFTNFIANASLDTSIILTSGSYNTFKNFSVNTTTGNAIQLTTDSFNNSFDDFNSVGNGGSGYGIRLIIRSRNNTFSNARINTSGSAGRGIYMLTNSSGNSFTNISINTPVADCVYISSSQLNMFKNINCTGVAANTYGFNFLANASNNYINNSNVFTNGQNAHGIYITNSFNNFFQNMNITTVNSSAYGVEVAETSTNNTIDLSVITTFGTSATGYRTRYLGDNNTVSNSIINTSAVSATKVHYVNKTYGNKIFNVTYEGQSRNQTYIGGLAGITDGDSYIINIINLNRSGIVCGAATNLNNITIQWQVKINVTDHAGNPIDGATCNSTNNQGIFQNFGATGADGLTSGVRMNESFFDCSPAWLYYNLTNITCEYSGTVNSTNVTIISNNSVNIRIFAGGDLEKPFIYQNAPGNMNATTDTVIYFNCTATDNMGLATMGIKVWNSTNDLIYQNFSATSGSISNVSFIGTFSNLGPYNWSCNVSDASGNSNYTNNRTFIIDDIPYVQQNYPQDQILFVNATLDFNCSVADKVGLGNVTIFIWNSTGLWRNITTIMRNFANFTNWTISSLPLENYTWTCNVTDYYGLVNSTGNRSFEIGTFNCGEQLIRNFTLTTNYNCSGTAFWVNRSDLVLNCSSYWIEYARADQGANGIDIRSINNVTVKNCFIWQQNLSTATSYINATYIYNCSNVLLNNITTFSFKNRAAAIGTRLMTNSQIINSVFNSYGSSTTFYEFGTIKIVGTSSYNLFSNISIFANNTYAMGIYLISPSNNYSNIRITTLSDYGDGIYTSSSGLSNMENITIFTYGSVAPAIFLNPLLNSYLNNLNLTTNGSRSSAILVSGFSVNTNFSNSNLSTRNESAPKVQCFSDGVNPSCGILILNSSFIGQTSNQTYLGYGGVSGGNLTLLNVSGINKSAIFFNTVSAWSNVTIKWYVRVNVSNASSSPIAGASVNYTNNQSIGIDMGLTNANGLTEWYVLNDTMFRGAGGYLVYSMHNFSAGKFVFVNSTNVTVNQSMTVNITLNVGDYILPFVYQNFPADSNATNFTTIYFNCTATDDTALGTIGVKVWNSTNGLIYQNVSSVSGLINNASFIGIFTGYGRYNWSCNATDSYGNLNYTQNRTFIIDDNPYAQQETPDNNTYTVNNSMTFNCSAYDYVGLSNITLLIYNSTSLYYNNSISVSNSINSSVWTRTNISDGNYTWYCNISDSNGFTNFTRNRTFEINYISCGETIVRNTTMLYKMDCSGTAITIGANGVTLDCNGFTIRYANFTPGYGLNVTGVNYSNVKNCRILQYNNSISEASNSYAVYIFNANNLTLFNTSIEVNKSLTGFGIVLGGNVTNCTFNQLNVSTHGTNGFGIFLSASASTISNNAFTNISITTNGSNSGNDGAYGFQFAPSTNGVITFTILNHINITTSGDAASGISIAPDSEGSFRQNNFSNISSSTSGGGAYGLKLLASGSQIINNLFEFSNLTVTNMGTRAIYMESYTGGANISNNTFNDISLNTAQLLSYKFYFNRNGGDLLQDINITNARFYGQLAHEFYLSGGAAASMVGNIIVLNATNLNKSAVTFGLGSNQSIDIRWYARANVTDHSGSPISSASVNSTNNQSVFQDWGTTDANGFTGWKIVNDTIIRQTNASTLYNPHNLTAKVASYEVNSTNFTIDSTMTINLRLKSEGVPVPIVLLISPLNNSNYTNQATIPFNCTVLNFSALRNVTITIWNASARFYNATTDLRNLENSTVWNVHLNPGAYNWTCNATNSTNYVLSNGTNFTVNYFSVNPSVFLTFPADKNYTTSTSMTFNCSATDPVNLSNITLYIWNSTNGLYYNNTKAAINPSNHSTWTLNSIPDGIYNWTCNATDSVGNIGANGTNRSFRIDSTSPKVYLIYPEDMNYSSLTTMTFNCSVTDNYNISDVTIFIWNSSNNLYFSETNYISNTVNWSNWTLVDIPQGRYNWTCNATDYFGNVGANGTNRTFFIDLANPQALLNFPANESIISTSSVTLNCSGKDNMGLNNITVWMWNSTKGLYYNNTKSLLGTDNFTTWALTSVPNGIYNWTCNTTDKSGRVGVNGTNFTFTINNIAPSVILVFPQDNNVTSSTSIRFNCSATDVFGLSNITIFIWNSTKGLYYNKTNSVSGLSNSTNWSLSSIPQGKFNWTCNASNTAGIEGANGTNRSFTIDTTAPKIWLIYPANNNATASTTVYFNCSVTDAVNNSNVTLYIWNASNSLYYSNTKNATGTANHSIWTLVPIASGTYNWTCSAIDQAGNTGYNGTNFTFTVDNNYPSVFMRTPINRTNSSTGNLEFNCSATDNRNLSSITIFIWNMTYDLYYNDSNSVTGVSNWTNWSLSSIPDGIYNWTCNATDSVGNNVANGTNFTFTVDLTAPQILLNLPNNNTNFTAEIVTFNCSALDNYGLKNISLFIWNESGNLYNYSTTQISGTANSSKWVILGFVNGTYNWTCNVSDSAGNEGYNTTFVFQFIISKINVTLNVVLPTGITSVNFTCLAPYMNNTPPNGQYPFRPILNVTNVGDRNYTNITIALNQSLSSGFSIWAQSANYRNPSSISLTTDSKVLIKRLYINQSISIWMFGECLNVSDNQTIDFSFIWGGGIS